MYLFAAVTSVTSLLAERLRFEAIRVQGVLIAARPRTVGYAFKTEQGMSGSYQDILIISLTLRLLMSYIYIYIYIYIYGAAILDVSRSHTTTHHSR